ncbi:hypothetical protein GW626_11590 [Peribacillus muralis]|uniref:hypothetical protein n=1 Tax=Peribacillus muralis TaxID=264697 RepID=UPI001F4EED49|nr:hypothetical protein [Peribacillus muralis]MCK1990977.1 hypothetical protein [Peribacillus muralis]MCK2011531.1 hypothetical protein [Peribacillus muralis]
MAETPAEEFIHYIAPKGEYIAFVDDEDYIAKGLEWKLFTARSVKRELLYKSGSYQGKVKLAGYEQYGNGLDTVVVEFENGRLSCIHPSYLKEMQSSNFGKELLSGPVSDITAISSDNDKESASPITKASDSLTEEPKKAKTKSKKATATPKLDLPVEKVHFTATVKEFTAKMNHFTGEEDEVILLSNVKVTTEPELSIGDGWCGYSKTLKKAELEEGDEIEFDGKVVDKKYNKEIRYKINNPSKLVKRVEA